MDSRLPVQGFPQVFNTLKHKDGGKFSITGTEEAGRRKPYEGTDMGAGDLVAPMSTWREALLYKRTHRHTHTHPYSAYVHNFAGNTVRAGNTVENRRASAALYGSLPSQPHQPKRRQTNHGIYKASLHFLEHTYQTL